MAYPFVKIKAKGCLLEQAEKGYADARETYWRNRIKGKLYEGLEAFALEKIRGHFQDMLEQPRSRNARLILIAQTYGLLENPAR